MEPKDHFQKILERIRDQGLYRSLTPLPGSGGRIETDSGTLLNFSSNDYLNLANDPRLKEAAKRAVDEYGCGATASRSMAGNLELHETLEVALARFTGQESALVFPAGFQMNLGVMSSLFDRYWTIFSDTLNHASLIDGCRLSKARVIVYPHRDLDSLDGLLRTVPGPVAIVTESVFSMDGDLAPIEALDALAKDHEAMLIVDEAHAIGVYGGGLCKTHDVRPDITLGTLGKGLGSGGGFAATSSTIREVLINTARSFIFSTGLAPACAGAALEALRILEAEPELGATLLARATNFRDALRKAGFEVPEDASAIIPLIVGANEATLELSAALLEQGILATAIRPPTVPEGTSRLRLSVTLAHDDNGLERTAAAIAQASS